MNFIEQLKQIPDHRKSKGKRHPLWLVMCLTLLGVLCGYHGYHPLADFYVEREGWRDDKPFFESIGYISDLALNASQFLDPIRLHWGIENRLHWLRDVLFQEDTGLRRGGNAKS